MQKPHTVFRLGPAILAGLLAGILGLTANAQQPLGNISGTVTDSSSAVVSGATVKATSLATGATRTATTDDQGYFLLPTLQAGEYKLSISRTGFAEFQVDRIVVAVGQI